MLDGKGLIASKEWKSKDKLFTIKADVLAIHTGSQ